MSTDSFTSLQLWADVGALSGSWNAYRKYTLRASFFMLYFCCQEKAFLRLSSVMGYWLKFDIIKLRVTFITMIRIWVPPKYVLTARTIIKFRSFSLSFIWLSLRLQGGLSFYRKFKSLWQLISKFLSTELHQRYSAHFIEQWNETLVVALL